MAEKVSSKTADSHKQVYFYLKKIQTKSNIERNYKREKKHQCVSASVFIHFMLIKQNRFSQYFFSKKKFSCHFIASDWVGCVCSLLFYFPRNTFFIVSITNFRISALFILVPQLFWVKGKFLHQKCHSNDKRVNCAIWE